MRIYGYPGQRVDFVARSGAAGSIFFGDSQHLCEEFFGPAHTRTPGSDKEEALKEQPHYQVELGYFHDSIIIGMEDGKVAFFRITPARSREKLEVYLGRTKLNSLSPSKAAELADAPEVELQYCTEGTGELETVIFRA